MTTDNATAVNAFDLLFVFCLIGVFVAAARDDFRLGIAAAGFAIVCLQIGVNLQLQRRVQALVRLLEKT